MKGLLFLILLFSGAAYGQDESHIISWEDFSGQVCNAADYCKGNDSILEYQEGFTGPVETLTREFFEDAFSELNETLTKKKVSLLPELSEADVVDIEIQIAKTGKILCETTASICGGLTVAGTMHWAVRLSLLACTGSALYCKDWYEKRQEEKEAQLKSLNEKRDEERRNKEAEEKAKREEKAKAKRDAEEKAKEAAVLAPGNGSGDDLPDDRNSDRRSPDEERPRGSSCRYDPGYDLKMTENGMETVKHVDGKWRCS